MNDAMVGFVYFDTKMKCIFSQFASLVSFDSVHPGYVKWEKVVVPHSLQINLKFKTQSENGLIYHLVNADGSPASTLSLDNNRLVLESQGERLETNTPEIRFNDDEWHVITATHNETTLKLDIDDVEQESTDTAPYPRQVNDGALYVGSVPDELRNSVNAEPFVGCIGDTTLNGLIVNFANSTERPHAHLAQCNRPDQGKYIIICPVSLPHPRSLVYRKFFTLTFFHLQYPQPSKSQR